jgi:hypothetical protein
MMKHDSDALGLSSAVPVGKADGVRPNCLCALCAEPLDRFSPFVIVTDSRTKMQKRCDVALRMIKRGEDVVFYQRGRVPWDREPRVTVGEADGVRLTLVLDDPRFFGAIVESLSERSVNPLLKALSAHATSPATETAQESAKT